MPQSDFEQRDIYKDSKYGNYNSIRISKIRRLADILSSNKSTLSMDQRKGLVSHIPALRNKTG